MTVCAICGEFDKEDFLSEEVWQQSIEVDYQRMLHGIYLCHARCLDEGYNEPTDRRNTALDPDLTAE